MSQRIFLLVHKGFCQNYPNKIKRDNAIKIKQTLYIKVTISQTRVQVTISKNKNIRHALQFKVSLRKIGQVQFKITLLKIRPNIPFKVTLCQIRADQSFNVTFCSIRPNLPFKVALCQLRPDPSFKITLCLIWQSHRTNSPSPCTLSTQKVSDRSSSKKTSFPTYRRR